MRVDEFGASKPYDPAESEVNRLGRDRTSDSYLRRLAKLPVAQRCEVVGLHRTRAHDD